MSADRNWHWPLTKRNTSATWQLLVERLLAHLLVLALGLAPDQRLRVLIVVQVRQFALLQFSVESQPLRSQLDRQSIELGIDRLPQERNVHLRERVGLLIHRDQFVGEVACERPSSTHDKGKDELRGDWNDGEDGSPLQLRTDLLKLHQLAMAVLNEGIAQPGSRFIRVRRRSGRSGIQHDERAGTGTGNTPSVDRVVPGKPALCRL